MAEVQETPEGLALPVTLHTRGGLHARPAARLAQEAQHFSSDIQIQSDNGTADAKSMLDILSLAISAGCSLTLLARGDDAREALTALADYLENLQDCYGTLSSFRYVRLARYRHRRAALCP